MNSTPFCVFLRFDKLRMGAPALIEMFYGGERAIFLEGEREFGPHKSPRRARRGPGPGPGGGRALLALLRRQP